MISVISPLLEKQGFSDVEAIDEGGSSWVFKAVKDSGNAVAIKVFKPPYEKDWKERIKRETAILSRLEQHRGIVKVFAPGLFVVGDCVAMAMEYVRGSSLAKFSQASRLSEPQVILVLKHISDVLEYVHLQKIIHRDLHAGNVMLRGDKLDDIVVVDFASARDYSLRELQQEEEYYRTFRPIGSMSHCAPEKWENPHGAREESDIFSVGVMVYKLLVGEAPYYGTTYVDLYNSIRRGEHRPAKMVRLDISTTLNDLIEDMINPDILRRTPSAKRLGERLKGLVGRD